MLLKDLRGLKADISAATSYDDLRERIVRRYRDTMDPKELAELVQRTRLMANLAGRLAIAKESR